MKTLLGLLACTTLPVLASVGASENFDDGYALANDKGCFECHALGRTEAGPSFAAVARRYRFDPEARKRLAYVIRGGSAGHWSDRFPMWPQAGLSDEEVRQLVDWVLSQ